MIPVLYTTFNRLSYTKLTLPVLIQNTPGAEIIVIDNGSTDGTVEYLLDQRGIAQIILERENTGISGAMNTFFDMTDHAPIVSKIDNDTLVPPGWLDALSQVLDKANLEIVQANHYFMSTQYRDWDDLISKRPVKHLPNGTVAYAKVVGGSGVVFRRGIITEPLEDSGLYGWGNFQYKHKEHRRAMFGGVFVELLDMKFYNQFADDIDFDYFLSTGRFEKRG